MCDPNWQHKRLRLLKLHDELTTLENFVEKTSPPQPHTKEVVRNLYLARATKLRQLLKPFDETEKRNE